jgi:alpha-L-fucosidase 2
MALTRRTAAGLLAGAPALMLNGEDAAAPPDNASSAGRMSRYNVVWHSPSQDASGVMPIGNGDVAAGVYAIENGALYLLLSKNDAFTYMGDIFKTGRVRVALDPNPFASGKAFRQTLDVPTGSILIEADGVALRIWADANRNVYHVEIDSSRQIAVKAGPEFWTRFDSCSFNSTEHYGKSSLQPPPAGPTQDVRLERDGRLLWYFPVGDRSVYPDDLKYYQVEHMAARFPDPYRFNTFGNLLDSPDLKLKDGALQGAGKRFDIRIHALAMQAPKAETYVDALWKQAARPVNLRADWDRHRAWWRQFWLRSWIVASDRSVPAGAREKLSGEASAQGMREDPDGAALVAQSYNVFRFLMACQSRGRIQVKFNGGLFTQQLRVPSADKQKRSGDRRPVEGGWLLHEDDRLWGRRFTYQNQRLLYWPLLASGDFDLLKPFFSYYADLLPMRQAITKAWFGHDGAYYRENIEPTGAERDCARDGRPPRRAPGKAADYYHDYYFTCGLETAAMMADYVNYTGDAAFRDRVLVPFAREVLIFFDLHYPRDSGGKLRLDPAQVLETWWLAVNPAPDVAGLRFCLDELLAMKAGTADDQARWRRFRAEIPDVPLQTIEGRQALAPAAKWAERHNSENGELYPVFPFRCFGVGLGSAGLIEWTMKYRSLKDAFGAACWTQDQIQWAYAGKAWEAAQGLVRRFRTASTMCRFPLYGREGPDSCPDFDHFGAGSIALQRMIVQEAGGKILLLPAWPAGWDADFKLCLTRGAVLTGSVKDGTLAAWDVQPASRKQDVVVMAPSPAG